MIYPHCQHEIEPEEPPAPVLLKIRGKPMRIVKRTEIKKRYIVIDDEEVLFVRPIPVLIVEEI